MTIKDFLNFPSYVTQRLDQILKIVKAIQRKEETMSAELDALEAAVTENEGLDESIIQLVNGLAAQIATLKEDPVKLQALADSLRTQSAALSAAIQANTPVA